MNFATETKLFLNEFLKNRKAVGSVIRSSSFLARKMTYGRSFKNAKTIVELGPGLGCITKRIVRSMHPLATLTTVEINPDFCRELRKRFAEPRVRVLNVGAEHMSRYIAEPVDYIASGIPLANLSEAEQTALFTEIRNVLAPKGVYVQFQYSLASLELLKKYFSVRLRFTPFNIPPAFVYMCRKQ